MKAEDRRQSQQLLMPARTNVLKVESRFNL
jgi:hypothetical protein